MSKLVVPGLTCIYYMLPNTCNLAVDTIRLELILSEYFWKDFKFLMEILTFCYEKINIGHGLRIDQIKFNQSDASGGMKWHVQLLKLTKWWCSFKNV